MAHALADQSHALQPQGCRIDVARRLGGLGGYLTGLLQRTRQTAGLGGICG